MVLKVAPMLLAVVMAVIDTAAEEVLLSAREDMVAWAPLIQMTVRYWYSPATCNHVANEM